MKRLLLVLLLFSLVFAQIEEPKLVKQLDSVITQTGAIRVVGGQMYSVEINVTVPQESLYQKVDMGGTLVDDAEGNRLATLSHDSPPNPFAYSVQSTVSTSERTTKWLPTGYEVPDDYLVYTQPSESAQSNDPAIKALAQEITAGLVTDFERVSALAIWVHNNIEYDLSIVGQRKDATWVLQNERGVCVEYSSLFAALARSLGYPTRYVLGKSYGEYGWLGHAWNEAYIGDWVPVDATWLEVGHLDATHIEFFRSAESSAPQKVVAKVSGDASIQAETPEFGGEADGVTVEISDVAVSRERADYNFSLVAPSLGFGQQTLAILAIEGTDYRVLDLRLVPCRAEIDLIEIEAPGRAIVLEPGKTSYAAWLLTTATGLDPGIKYTCPLTLNSRYLDEKSAALSIQKTHKPSGLKATIYDSALAPGQEVSVYADAERGEQITVAGDGYLHTRPASRGAIVFSFTPTHTGTHSVFVAAESGGVEELQYTVEKEAKVYIKKIDTPARVLVGEESDFNITLSNAGSKEEKVSIRVSIGDVEQLTHLVIEESADIAFFFSPGYPGNETLVVEVSGEGFSDTKTLPVTVYDEPWVEVGTASIAPANGNVVVAIPVDSSNSVREVTLSMAGQQQTLVSGNATFQVGGGVYVLTIAWTDLNGEPHSEARTINTALPEKDGIGGLTTLAIAVVGVLVLVFLIYAGRKIWAERKAVEEQRKAEERKRRVAEIMEEKKKEEVVQEKQAPEEDKMPYGPTF
ncbi:MAG: hypothetical protein KAW41_00265 [Candidatus Diapherotrites archaeon]|nr:hypothetical protein [Candidatus Diapherotrites archaeon]